jgi:hypothetical protein
MRYTKKVFKINGTGMIILLHIMGYMGWFMLSVTFMWFIFLGLTRIFSQKLFTNSTYQYTLLFLCIAITSYGLATGNMIIYATWKDLQ